MKTILLVIYLVASASVVAAGADKLRLRDGTVIEGMIANPDAQGFSFSSKYGSVHYDWIQVDLNDLRRNNPSLYEFICQKFREQSLVDQIVNDAQILEFLSGRYMFKSEANKVLKGYGMVLERLDAARNVKNSSQRDQQLKSLAAQQRSVLLAFNLRCQQLATVTRNDGIHSILMSYRQAMDSLLSNNTAGFLSAYAHAREAALMMGR